MIVLLTFCFNQQDKALGPLSSSSLESCVSDRNMDLCWVITLNKCILCNSTIFRNNFSASEII